VRSWREENGKQVRRSEKFLRSFRKQVRSEKHPQIIQTVDNQHKSANPVENKKSAHLRNFFGPLQLPPGKRGQWGRVYVKTYPQNVTGAMSVAVVWVALWGWSVSSGG
jgi:hypothetical protein